MSYDFHKKVVILTGGGRGLGVGIARAFSRCGATLVITGSTEESMSLLTMLRPASTVCP